MNNLIRAGKGELNDVALAAIGEVVWKTVGTKTGREVARNFFHAGEERRRKLGPLFKGRPIPR